MDTFLPEGTEVEESSSLYFKPKAGMNRIRILGSAIVGREGWTTVEGKRKPVRKTMEESFGVDEIDDPEQVKTFWAMPVWDYADKRVKVYEITPKTIRKAILGLTKNEDWGSPILAYDIDIERSGDKLDTEYTVSPVPPKATDQSILDAWAKVKTEFDLNRLFSNGDPFNSSKE